MDGVISLTKSAALEYAPRGIHINAVCPGTIDTPMVADMLEKQADAMKEIMRDQPIGRLGRSDEIAAYSFDVRDQLPAHAVQGRTLAEYQRYVASQRGDGNRQSPYRAFAYVRRDGVRRQHR